MEVAFENLDKPEMLVASKDGKIILESNLLAGDKDSQAMIAALLASQNGINSVAAENESGKKETDRTLESMKDIATAFLAAHDLLGSEYNSMANTENFAAIAELYKEGDDTGLFVLYGELLSEEKKRIEAAKAEQKDEASAESAASNDGSTTNNDGTSDTSDDGTEVTPTTTINLEYVLRLDWYQNDKGNNDYLLGTNLSNEEYEARVKEILIEKEYEKRGLKGKTGIDIENIKKYIKAALPSDEDLLKANKYKSSRHKEIKLGDYGCTLSTAVYIVYSITGKVYSLKEANDILTKKDVFVDPTDRKSVV